MASRRLTAVRTASTLALAWLCAGSAGAEPFLEGRVVRVFDGDTLEVLLEDEELLEDDALRRVRLAGIDTPERGQPWANRAKQALSDRVAGAEVRINEVAVDRYGNAGIKAVLVNDEVRYEERLF